MTQHDPDSAALSQKLNNLVSSLDETEERQKEILQAMLGVARGITNDANGAEAPNLQQDFEEAFEALPAEKVNMLLSYKNGDPPMIVGHPDIPEALWKDGQPAETGTHRAVTPRILRNPDK